MTERRGRELLQTPGPSNVPDRILRAMDRATIDHRGREFARLSAKVREGLQDVIKTEGDVVIYPSSGTGAWEAALVNTLSPGDRVLVFDIGHFAGLWAEMAGRLGLRVEVIQSEWRTGVDPNGLGERLSEDLEERENPYSAVMVVHNETSTGVTSRIEEIGKVLRSSGHPALFLVDAVSSLACMEYRQDEWGVDVTVGASQKGLMMPPGLAFNGISERAFAASKENGFRRSYWDWQSIVDANRSGGYSYTPATNMFYGLSEAISMLQEEGLERVFQRHSRHAEATRRAVAAWGLEVFATDPSETSSSVTGVLVPEDSDADQIREIVYDYFGISLGAGLSRLRGRVFRIGHLGDFNDLMLLATVSGIEAGLVTAEVSHRSQGVQAAVEFLTEAL